MNEKYTKAYLNPTRQRILQVIIEKGEASSAQILEVLSDVPRASLYRHIKLLLDAGVIEVVREEAKRGTVEKTYAMATPKEEEQNNAAFQKLVQAILFSISADFTRYLSDEDNNPEKDMLAVGSANLMLTDEEFMEFINSYSSLLQNYLEREPSEERKLRKVTFISSPLDS